MSINTRPVATLDVNTVLAGLAQLLTQPQLQAASTAPAVAVAVAPTQPITLNLGNLTLTPKGLTTGGNPKFTVELNLPDGTFYGTFVQGKSAKSPRLIGKPVTSKPAGRKGRNRR